MSTAYSCPFCGRSFENSGGLSRHYSKRPECAAQRDQLLTEQFAIHMQDAIRANDDPDANLDDLPDANPDDLPDANPDDHPDTNPDDHPDANLDHPDANLDDHPDANLDNNHHDNDTPDIRMNSPSPAPSPSPSPSPSPDPDNPEHGNWDGPGPHYAPRPARFGSAQVECHPTGGRVKRWVTVEEVEDEGEAEILRNKAIFMLGEWLGRVGISNKDRDDFFKLPTNAHLPWENVKQFYESVDALPHGPDWHRETLTVHGDEESEILDLWKRDTLEVVRQLLSDPRFRDHICYAPERHTNTEGQRVYSETWTGEWWWRIQNLLGEHATAMPVIVASDATQLSVLSGSKKAWPVYLTIGNISKDLRRRPSQRATILVGYIPVTDLKCIADETKRRERQWSLFHTCLAKILAPLREVCVAGVDMVCADGGIRHVHPILAAYIADWPEQCTVACTMTSRCPVCSIQYHERGGAAPGLLRTKHGALRALKLEKDGYSVLREGLGMRRTWPFWLDMPFANGGQLITPDLLHQLHKGVFKSHIVKWCTRLLTADEIDRRFMGMTNHHGIRHFKWGLSKITQWTGNEAKAIAKVFLPVIAGSQPSEAVGAARSIIDFMFLAHLPQIDETDLAEMEADLASFHDYKHIFKSTKALQSQKGFNGIPKIHMAFHCISKPCTAT
ncbi:hypothetical protein FRC06_004093 [Ceratobasidium sp. 370]|nr:hypothetical protein FRC06_004093 [Ceratobasidium sp. 370]